MTDANGPGRLEAARLTHGASDYLTTSPTARVAGAFRGASKAAGTRAPRLVCLIGMQRTGTSHLNKILSYVPEIESRSELFHPWRCMWMHPHEIEDFSRRVGKKLPCSCENRRQTIRMIRRRPDLVLDCLVDLMAPEKQILTFKVFPGHLSVRQVTKAIISRPDCVIIFVRRRPIDAYVSKLKAKQVGQWARVDTTEMKVEVAPRQFLRWNRRMSAWYRRLEGACWMMGKPFHRLTYEGDLAASPRAVSERFSAVLEASGLGPFTLPPDDATVGLTRQDRNTDVRDKIANWGECHRYLAAKGSLDRAFDPIPEFQPTFWDRLLLRPTRNRRSEQSSGQWWGGKVF